MAELRHYKSDWKAFELILKGLYPRLYEENLNPRRFYNGYLQAYVEHDVRALINLRDLSHFQKFLALLAGRVGHVVNFMSLSNDVSVSATTIKSWLSVLKASYVVFKLPPFFVNICKRLINLLGIRTEEQAFRDPL